LPSDVIGARARTCLPPLPAVSGQLWAGSEKEKKKEKEKKLSKMAQECFCSPKMP
jgi:hypothetical protein